MSKKKDFTTVREIGKPALIFMAAIELLMGDAIITGTVLNGMIYALVWNVVLGALVLGVALWVAGRLKE